MTISLKSFVLRLTLSIGGCFVFLLECQIELAGLYFYIILYFDVSVPFCSKIPDSDAEIRALWNLSQAPLVAEEGSLRPWWDFSGHSLQSTKYLARFYTVVVMFTSPVFCLWNIKILRAAFLINWRGEQFYTHELCFISFCEYIWTMHTVSQLHAKCSFPFVMQTRK